MPVNSSSLHQSTQNRARWVHAVVLFAFTLQAIVPAGFMPAAVSTGQLVKLCPTGLSSELMSILHPQHQLPSDDYQHHGSHHQQLQPQTENMLHDDQWRADCPFGVVAASDLLAQSWSRLSLAYLGTAQQSIFSDLFIVPNPFSAHPARAPPSTAS